MIPLDQMSELDDHFGPLAPSEEEMERMFIAEQTVDVYAMVDHFMDSN